LADLQKALSGEFNKKIHEWEKLKGGQQWLSSPTSGNTYIDHIIVTKNFFEKNCNS